MGEGKEALPPLLGDVVIDFPGNIILMGGGWGGNYLDLSSVSTDKTRAAFRFEFTEMKRTGSVRTLEFSMHQHVKTKKTFVRLLPLGNHPSAPLMPLLTVDTGKTQVKSSHLARAGTEHPCLVVEILKPP